MAENEMTYFKFVTDLIDSGIWAELSPGARTLYPVLLRFSDRHFKPVFPGSQILLKLTGFKQKSSLRKARKELSDHGLIWIEEGTGRKNSKYFFRFDWGGAKTPPRGLPLEPPEGEVGTPPGILKTNHRGSFSDPPYNQIHISINNNVPVQSNSKGPELESYVRRFGQKAVDLAISELKLGGMTVNDINLKSILLHGIQKKEKSWSDIEKYLSEKISPGSLDILKSAFKKEEDGIFIFSDEIPAYLKNILQQLNTEVFFEPSVKSHRFWESQGVSI
jgi:hypothetical protein